MLHAHKELPATRVKLFILFLAVAASCRSSLAGRPCRRPPSLRPAACRRPPSPRPPQVTVQRMEFVAETGRLTFWGESSLTESTFLVVRLLQEGKPVAWWQAEGCTEVAGGAWQLVTPVPHGALEPGVDHELRVGAEGVAGGEAVFWFDLSGPGNPAR